MLIRRHDRTGELAYHRCWTPTPVPLADLVAVAGQRWRIDESFQTAKGLVGLDQHQVRRWTSWHRWTVLAMLAHAFLGVAAAAERDREHQATPAPTGLIEVTVAELRRLFDPLLRGDPQADQPLRLVTMAPATSSTRPSSPLPSPRTTMRFSHQSDSCDW